MRTLWLNGGVRTALSLSGLVAVLAILVVGCGESEDSTAAPPVTTAEFIRKADLICTKADAMQPDELEKFQVESRKELGRLAGEAYEATVARDHIIPSVKEQIKELEALKPPDGEAKEVAAILAGFNKAVREGKEDPYLIANFWDPQQDPLAPINKIATRYGFESCNELR